MIFREDARVEAEFAQALFLSHFSISKHKGWDHGWSNPFHDKVCAQRRILTIGSLRLQQILFELLVKEVVSTTLLLWFQDKLLWIFYGPLYYFVNFSTFLTEILQAPDSLE